MVSEICLLVSLVVCAWLAFYCELLLKRDIELRNELRFQGDREQHVRADLYEKFDLLSASKVELRMASTEVERLRDALLDARCRLEIIDDEVGFWVDDKMELRWGVRPKSACDYSLSSELVSEGVGDCA